MSELQTTSLDEKLRVIENLTKIITTESILSIYFYFLVYGPSTPAILKEKLGMKKTTLFRNLNVLKDEDLVEQLIDSNVKDKRHQIIYQIKHRIQNKTNIIITDELLEYSNKTTKQFILTNWKDALIKSPNFFSSILSKLFYQCVKSPPLFKHKQDVSPLEEDLKIGSPYQILTFSVFDGEPNSQELKEIMSLLDKIHKLKMKTDENKTKKLNNPIAFSITLLNFGKI